MERIFVNCYFEKFEANIFLMTPNNMKNYIVIENFVRNKFKPIKREEIDFSLVGRKPSLMDESDVYEDTIRDDVKNYDNFYMEQDLGNIGKRLRSLIAFQANEVEIDGKDMIHLVMIDLVRKFKIETLVDKEVKYIGKTKDHECFITFALYLMYIFPELGYYKNVEDFKHFIECVTPYYVLEDVIKQLNEINENTRKMLNEIFFI